LANSRAPSAESWCCASKTVLARYSLLPFAVCVRAFEADTRAKKRGRLHFALATSATTRQRISPDRSSPASLSRTSLDFPVDPIGTELTAKLLCDSALISVWEGAWVDIAEFLREKAAQCRALAEEVASNDAVTRGMLALALELDAQAVAVEAGRVAAREIEAVATNGGEKP
jgi:hypothetical protein